MNYKKLSLIIAISIVVISLAFVLGFHYFKQPTVINNSFTFEYGESIDINKLNITDTNEIELIHSSLENIEGYDYPDVGTYGLTYVYKNLFKEYVIPVTINVIDSKPPVFVKTVDNVQFIKGVKKPDYSSFFEAEDETEIKYQYILDDVDYSTPGTYAAKIIATDSSFNKTEFEFEVTIIDDTEQIIDGISYIKGIMIINKKHPLPKDYAPGEDPKAVEVLTKLIEEAKKEGMQVSDSYSGFRSYDYQSSLYWNYVSKDGQAQADRYSARPGYSEHQSGFAFDLRTPNGALLNTEPEIKWLAENAHKFGFIVRYPEDKEDITGYMYEPWHLRYVGDIAQDIYKSGLTLEEYLGFEGGTSY